MRLVYLGSGAFGLPTLRGLAAAKHEIMLVVTQPDRPAGRDRQPSPTPIAQFAEKAGIEVVRPENVNEPDVIRFIQDVNADAFVVIAYGQKLSRPLLDARFAVNLHASLLPKYRGAAPINWAIINGEKTTGLSVITLADRMDAGDVLGQVQTPIDPHETAGELHDRLAELGPGLMNAVLSRMEAGTLTRERQDESRVTHAPKLSKKDGTVSFDQPAERVRARVHGLTPWPGCRVRVADGIVLRLHRVAVAEKAGANAPAGTLLAGGRVACDPGVVRLLAVHPPGGKMMSFEALMRGRPIEEGTLLRPLEAEDTERAAS